MKALLIKAGLSLIFIFYVFENNAFAQSPIYLVPESIDFGSISPGTSRTSDIEIHNTLDIEVYVYMDIITEGSNYFFLQSEQYDTIPALGFKTKQISFSPKETGFFSASFDVYLSGTEVPVSAELIGSGEIQTELTVTPSEQLLPAEAGTAFIDIKSNIFWNVSYEADWFTIYPTSGTNNGTLSVTYSENTTLENRSATVFVSGDSITRSVSLIQEPVFFLYINPTEILVPGTSGNTTFDISSNSIWQVTDDADWLTIVPEGGSNNKTLVASFAQNLDTSSRTATITVRSGEELIAQASITQESGILNVDPASRVVSNIAGSTTFDITSNSNWSVGDDAFWLNVVPMNGSNNQTITASYSANTDSISRTGTITVTSGRISRNVTVIQTALDFLEVSPVERIVSSDSGSTNFKITSNISWIASDNVDWLQITPRIGTNSANLIASFTQNKTNSSREASISIAGGGIIRTVKVIQSSANFLEINPQTRQVLSAAGSTTFDVSSNISWTVTDDADWLSVTPQSGANNQTITASYSENTNSSGRTATITITGGDLTKSVTVVQSGLTFLTVQPLSRSVSNTQGSTNFIISSNIRWSVRDNADWLTVSPDTGSNNGSLTASFTQNTGELRTATITVSGNNLTKSVTVTQSDLPFLEVEPLDISVPSNAGDTTFNISSNISWNVSEEIDWLNVTPQTGSDNQTLTISFSENTGTNSRSGMITITGSNITRDVIVTQSPATFLEVDSQALQLTNSAGNKTFEITSNINWTITDDADWLEVTPQSGESNQTITASYSENTTSSERTAIITISGSGISRFVSVNQSASQFLIVEPLSRSVSNAQGSTSFIISSNIKWNVQDDADWLTVSPDTGSNNGTITASFTENTGALRMATITISGSNITRSVTVTQSDLSFLEVDSLSLSVGSDEGTTSFTISSNVKWNITDDADWLTTTPSNGSASQSIIVSFSKNIEMIPRICTISITGAEIIKYVTLTQSAQSFLEVNPSSRTVSSDSGSIKVEIISNLQWTAKTDDGWLSVLPENGSNNGTLNILFSKNTTQATRVGTIIIDGVSLFRNVTITQPFKPVVSATAPDSVNIGEATQITITSPQDFSFTSKLFFYRKGGRKNFNRVDITPMSGNIFTIPADSITERGIQYYILFYSGGDSVSFPEREPNIHPASIRTYIREIPFGGNTNFGFQPELYKLISIPLEISSPGLTSVLEENFGPYNKLMWRIFRWDAVKQQYSEFPDINTGFEPGAGFMIITREGKSFSIKNSRSVGLDSPITITLLPGYNQIANPYAFKILWNDIEGSELVESPITMNSENKGWQDQNVLNPWESYFVYNRQPEPVNLVINPIEVLSEPLGNESGILSNTEFIVQIKSVIESSDFEDKYNYVGMRADAQQGEDKFDIHKPPSVSENISLKILSGNEEYVQNFVPVSKDGNSWKLKIYSEYIDKNVSMEFIERSARPYDFKLWLIDLDRKTIIPLINNKALVNMGSLKEKNLKLIIGTEEYAKNISEDISLIPSEYQLFQNFPNPFNPHTNIYYTLKQKSMVSLEIFDILGSKVRTLFSEELQEEGLKNITWDATNNSGHQVAGGIYIYRLRANGFTTSRKMILLK